MSKRVTINYAEGKVATHEEAIARLKSFKIHRDTARAMGREGDRELKEFFDNLPKEETDARMKKARKRHLETSIKNRNIHLHRGQYCIV